MRHVLSTGTQFNHININFHPLLQILGEALSKVAAPGSHHYLRNAPSHNCTVRQNCIRAQMKLIWAVIPSQIMWDFEKI